MDEVLEVGTRKTADLSHSMSGGGYPVALHWTTPPSPGRKSYLRRTSTFGGTEKNTICYFKFLYTVRISAIEADDALGVKIKKFRDVILVTFLWWHHWNEVIIDFLNFFIINLKNYNLAKSRNSRSRTSKVKWDWGALVDYENFLLK